MSLQINSRYIRTSPIGDETIVSIKNEQELAYHQGFLSDGFKYKEVVPSVAPGATCVSCEG